MFNSNILSDGEAIHALIARVITQGYDVSRCQTGGGTPNTHLRLKIDSLKDLDKLISAGKGYALEGSPDSYRPFAPNGNALEQVKSIANHEIKEGLSINMENTKSIMVDLFNMTS